MFFYMLSIGFQSVDSIGFNSVAFTIDLSSTFKVEEKACFQGAIDLLKSLQMLIKR
jgi:hypothetical protein